jgi:drug/metabolite transporter (DMT)-like permease
MNKNEEIKNEFAKFEQSHRESLVPKCSKDYSTFNNEKSEVSMEMKEEYTTFDLVQGLFFMACSCVFKSLFSILSKWSLQGKKDLSSFQLLTFRTYFMFWISIIALMIGKVNVFSEETIKRKQILALTTRTVLAIMSMSLVIYSLKYMHISDVYSIYYLYPALVILFSWLFLQEKVGSFDYFCLVSCFIGAILIVKPQFLFSTEQHSTSNSLFFLIVFCGAILKAIEDVIVRNVGKDVHFLIFPFSYALIGILLFPIPMAINDKVYPTFTFGEIVVLFLIGLCTFCYQMFMALGLQNENAGRVSMINYFQVALMYISDLSFFGKPFQLMELFGTFLIFFFNVTNGTLKAIKRIKQLKEFKEKNNNNNNI